MTREEIIEGLKLLEDNMVYFDELLNDKGEYIDVHELLFETIEALSAEPCEDCISRAELINKTIKRNSIWLKITDSRGMNLQEIIDELPSIQPKPKTDALDKIRTEIQENINYNKKMNYQGIVTGLLLTLDIIDKYKAESEEICR